MYKEGTRLKWYPCLLLKEDICFLDLEYFCNIPEVYTGLLELFSEEGFGRIKALKRVAGRKYFGRTWDEVMDCGKEWFGEAWPSNPVLEVPHQEKANRPTMWYWKSCMHPFNKHHIVLVRHSSRDLLCEFSNNFLINWITSVSENQQPKEYRTSSVDWVPRGLRMGSVLTDFVAMGNSLGLHFYTFIR